MKKTRISVKGMSCQHCVMRVKKALETLPGISNTVVEIGVVSLDYDETAVDLSKIEDAISKAGYKVKN